MRQTLHAHMLMLRNNAARFCGGSFRAPQSIIMASSQLSLPVSRIAFGLRAAPAPASPHRARKAASNAVSRLVASGWRTTEMETAFPALNYSRIVSSGWLPQAANSSATDQAAPVETTDRMHRCGWWTRTSAEL